MLFLSAKMSLDLQRKATSAMQTLFTQIVPHIYSLQKERWLHYMYRGYTKERQYVQYLYFSPFQNNTVDMYNFFFTNSHEAQTHSHCKLHCCCSTFDAANNIFFLLPRRSKWTLHLSRPTLRWLSNDSS